MNDELKLLKDVLGLSDLTENPSTGTMSIKLTSGTYTFMAYWQ
jgi:hypothetical protein